MGSRRFLSSIVVMALVTIFSGAAAAPTGVVVIIGNGTAGSCQSEAAVNLLSNAVAAGGVISFDCGPDPVTVHVNTNLTDQPVTVNGAGLVTLNGENLRQIFYVQNGGELTLNDLNLADGNAGAGGAIYIEAQAAVTINRSFVFSNEATGDGAGIYNLGALTINDSTLGSNIATGSGGGIFNDGGTVMLNRSYLISNQSQNGGAIYTVNGQVTLDRSAVRSSFVINQGGGVFAAGPVSITNSTFSNNRALQGGALFLEADVTILNATFNENRADTAGAIWREASSTTTLRNTIVAGSLDSEGNAPSLNCDGPAMTSLGRNIIGDAACVPNPGMMGDLLNTDPQLGVWFATPLRGYIPAPTSPAVNYGLDCPDVDQRGYPRPLGPACDVGSMEYGAVVYLPVILR